METRRQIVLLAAALAGCAAQPGNPLPENPPSLPDGMKVTLVTAHGISRNKAPVGVADYFTYDGQLIAYASFSWTDLDRAWAKQKIQFLWLNGDRLVRKTEVEVNFGKPPHHVWAVSQPTSLGAGDCRVEVYWQGQKLAQRLFRVVDATGPAAPNAAEPQKSV